jgi:hypothetical protein
MGQTNPLKRQVRELQPKPKVTPLSTQILQKKLKTSKERQVPQSDKNLKSITWSKDSVTPTLALDEQPNGSQTQSHVIETMLTEISESTKGDIEGEIFCYEAMNPQDAKNGSMGNNPLYAYKATADPDTMYLHQALREPDQGEFIKPMNKKVKDQMDNGNFSIVKASTVPKGTTVFPAVWQMRHKHDIKTREIEKYKTSLRVTPKIHINDPDVQMHAIIFPDDDLQILLQLNGIFSYFHTQVPTIDEMQYNDPIFLTPDSDNWDPYSNHFAENENSMLDWEGNMIPKRQQSKHLLDFDVHIDHHSYESAINDATVSSFVAMSNNNEIDNIP